MRYRTDQTLELKEECKKRNIPFEINHTSGHASPAALKRLASAIKSGGLQFVDLDWVQHARLRYGLSDTGLLIGVERRRE